MKKTIVGYVEKSRPPKGGFGTTLTDLLESIEETIFTERCLLENNPDPSRFRKIECMIEVKEKK